MRIVIAMMKHETNTFSPVPTPLSRFGGDGPHFGEAAIAAFRNTNTPMAAFLDLAEAAGAEVVTPVAGDAHPSGPVDSDAYERMTGAICDAVSAGCDAVMLDLHGAMVAETTSDGEGTLLERIREVAPAVPIAVALDLHTNLTEKMVRNATVLAGYRTYPHVDMYETGRRAGSILLDSLAGKVKPVMAWGNRPILAHTLRMGTDDSPMQELIALANNEEQNGLLDVTVFGGFPLADIPEAGLSVVTVADGDKAHADSAKDRLLDAAWEHRTDFVYRSEPLTASIARAKEITEGPVLLIDHADNCASGGTQDTMAVVAEVFRQGLENVAVGAIVDPEAVQQMLQAGVGARLSLALGGKNDLPAIGRQGQPLELTGTVRAITDGEFVVEGPMYTGVTVHMGPSAVFECGELSIVVISRHMEPFDLGVFRSLGIEPTEKRYLLLKSRIHYRAGFLPIAHRIIECAGEGVTSSDYSLFRFSNVRRPIHPIDGFAA